MSSFFATYGQHWDYWWPQFVPAIWVTLGITVLAYILAVVLGMLLALGKMSRIMPLRVFCISYIEFMRGVPALAILFLLYFGLTPLGIILDAFWAGVIGLGLSMGGYIAEVFRAGLQAVHRGQREASLAIGMTPGQTFRYIVFPQALRIILPPLLNMLIVLLKDSSLCALIAAPELLLTAKDLASESFLPMHLYLLVGVMYFALAWPMSLVTRRVEVRMKRGMRAVGA